METPEEGELEKKLGLREKPVKASLNGDGGNGGAGSEKDYLSLLELALLMPVLSLVKGYLIQSNGSKKTVENCMLEFRQGHPKFFFLMFCIDLLFRSAYLMVVIIVAVRGLGIDQYLRSFCIK